MKMAHVHVCTYNSVMCARLNTADSSDPVVSWLGGDGEHVARGLLVALG